MTDDDWRLLNNWVRALQTWLGIQVILLSLVLWRVW
jgi:hypothetical protein